MNPLSDGCVLSGLIGDCQRSGTAGATMQDIIETVLRQHVPEIREVGDVTRHAHGSAPCSQTT